VKIGADTAEERNAVLLPQLLIDESDVEIWNKTWTKKKLTLPPTQFFCSHSCSQSTSALGRLLGSLWKHCRRKSLSDSEQPSGIGGILSSTILNMTVKRKYVRKYS
jgi:hypothetical protein